MVIATVVVPVAVTLTRMTTRIWVRLSLKDQEKRTEEEKEMNAHVDRAKTAMKKVPVAIWVAITVVLMVALVAGLARATTPSKTALNGRALTAAKELLGSAKQLSKQAIQDVDPRQRSRDIDTGLAFIAAARFLAPDTILESKCGVKVDELFATLRALDSP